MAVTITTKFYETDSPAWQDLSKVVFTSPNMVSPNTAGTRSHILPGGAIPLGTWHEDLSNMYRVANEQEAVDSSYFGFTGTLYDAFDLDNPGAYITISGANSTQWIEYVRERVDSNFGSWPMHYETVVGVEELDTSGCTVTGTEGQNLVGVFTNDDSIIQDSASDFDMEITFPGDVTVTSFSSNPRSGYCPIYGYLYANSKAADPLDALGNQYWSSSTTNTEYGTCRTNTNVTDVYVYSLSDSQDANKKSAKNLRFWGYDFGAAGVSVTTSSGVSPENCFFPVGWYCDELTDSAHWLQFEFDSPKRITRVDFKNYVDYEVKDFKIQAKVLPGDAWTELYDGRALNNTFFRTPLQGFVWSNYTAYKYYRLYFENNWAGADGYGISNLSFYSYAEDQSVTDPISLYFDNDNIVSISTADNPAGTTNSYVFRLAVDSVTTGSGVISAGSTIYGWGWPSWAHSNYTPLNLTQGVSNSDTSIYVHDASQVSDGDTLYFLNNDLNILSDQRTVSNVVESPTSDEDTITVSAVSNPYGVDTTHVVVIDAGTDPEMNISNSITFRLTTGECYDCRLTAWDDVTHSTTSNEIIAGDHCRVSAVAYNIDSASAEVPAELEGYSFVHPPVYNRIFKGDTIYMGTEYYYGDFSMRFRAPGIYGVNAKGDFLIFRPMLYELHSGISYGVHDFVICLHYSYT